MWGGGLKGKLGDFMEWGFPFLLLSFRVEVFFGRASVDRQIGFSWLIDLCMPVDRSRMANKVCMRCGSPNRLVDQSVERNGTSLCDVN